MALVWPLGHGDSREEPALDSDRGRESTAPTDLDSRFRGSDALIFMALVWPLGHGDSRARPALDSDRGRESTAPTDLDSRLRGSDALIFMALVWPLGHGDSREEPALDSDRGRESTDPRQTWTPAFAGVTDRQFEPICAYRDADSGGVVECSRCDTARQMSRCRRALASRSVWTAIIVTPELWKDFSRAVRNAGLSWGSQ